MGDVVHTSRVKIVRERGPTRRAIIEGFSEPVYYGVHGGIKRFYKVEPEKEHAATLDLVSPLPGGARKVGVVKNREEQLRFAMEAMGRSLQPEDMALIMLEYSDNRPWVEEVRNYVAKFYPKTRIIVHPLSLTSGAHMGPGTWAIAFLPNIR